MSLKEIFCQDKAISILQRIFATGKVAHAYIFAGLEGVGKLKAAREWAGLTLCENPVIEKTDSAQFADSCGSCRSCRLLESDLHPDFNFVYKELVQFTREGKDRKTPVDLPKDVIREFLIDKVSTRPTLSRRKVFIVEEAEKLNAASQNSLLKVLEEAPEYCCIILLCTHLDRLLATTKSRCQIIRFTPIDEDRIIEKLEQMGIKQAQATYFARLAQGSLGRACQLVQLELADAGLCEMKKQLISSLSDSEYADALDLAERFRELCQKIAAIWGRCDEKTSKTDINRRTQKIIVQIIISALHDIIKLNIATEADIVNFDQRAQIEKLAERFDAETAAVKIEDCYRTLRWIDSSVNEKLIFEQLLLNLLVSDKMSV